MSLTSYYATAFVERSQKSVVNYPKWLCKQIEVKGMDDEDSMVQNLKHIRTFVSDVKLPRIYTILAQSFREFTVGGKHRIYLDHQRRIKEFGEDTVTSVEKDGFVMVGTSDGKPMVVDESNTFYVVNGKEYVVLGRIEDLMELDATKAPTEIAEFRLFKRPCP